MAQVVAKFPPRSVDNHSFGIPDFEPLLNSHQAAQLLDIHHKTLQSWLDAGRFTAPTSVSCGVSARPILTRGLNDNSERADTKRSTSSFHHELDAFRTAIQTCSRIHRNG
jgi:hypothetical protein